MKIPPITSAARLCGVVAEARNAPPGSEEIILKMMSGALRVPEPAIARVQRVLMVD